MARGSRTAGLAAVTVLLVTGLVGCGDGSKTAADRAAEPVPARTVAAWDQLSRTLERLSATLYEGGERPRTAEGALRRARSQGVELPDGVRLADYGRSGREICLTGRRDTYLALSPRPHQGRQRTFGTGRCDPAAGDILVRTVSVGGGETLALAEEVVTGRTLFDRLEHQHVLYDVLDG
jgi:hypothetical protein